MKRIPYILIAVVLVFGARYTAAQFDAADRVADTAPVYQLHGSGTSNPAQLVWKAGAGRRDAEGVDETVRGVTVTSNREPQPQSDGLGDIFSGQYKALVPEMSTTTPAPLPCLLCLRRLTCS